MGHAHTTSPTAHMAPPKRGAKRSRSQRRSPGPAHRTARRGGEGRQERGEADGDARIVEDVAQLDAGGEHAAGEGRAQVLAGPQHDPPPSEEVMLRPAHERTCGICGEIFRSRNAMMAHARAEHPTGHGAKGGRPARERRKKARAQTRAEVTPAHAPAAPPPMEATPREAEAETQKDAPPRELAAAPQAGSAQAQPAAAEEETQAAEGQPPPVAVPTAAAAAPPPAAVATTACEACEMEETSGIDARRGGAGGPARQAREDAVTSDVPARCAPRTLHGLCAKRTH